MVKKTRGLGAKYLSRLLKDCIYSKHYLYNPAHKPAPNASCFLCIAAARLACDKQMSNHQSRPLRYFIAKKIFPHTELGDLLISENRLVNKENSLDFYLSWIKEIEKEGDILIPLEGGKTFKGH